MTRPRPFALLFATSVLVVMAVAQVARDRPARFRVLARLTPVTAAGSPTEAETLSRMAGRRWTTAELARDWTRVASAGATTFRSPAFPPEDDISAVIVEFSADQRRSRPPLLLWSHEPSLTPAAFARNRRELTPLRAKRAVVVRGETLRSEDDERVRHLFLHLPSGDILSSSISGFAVLSAHDLAQAHAARVTRITVGDDSRDAIALAQGRRASYRADVPVGAELRVSVALPSGAGRAHVVQTTADGEFQLLDAAIAGKSWQPFRVPLRPGRQSSITLSTVDSSGASYWSVPVMVIGATDGRPNIILIVVDALRADMLAAGGSRAGLAPFMDKLTTRSLVFSRAYAAASWTKPSVATLFTSLFPQTHKLGARFYSDGLPDSVPTLQGLLAAAGYQTQQFTTNAFSAALTNLDRGFDSVVMPKRADGSFSITAADINARVFPWLEAHAHDRFFLYLHLVDTHPPFGSASGAATPRAAYEHAVTRVDQQLGRLYRELERRQMLDNTIMIITADHGEAFGEHGRTGHGQSVYDEEVRVPLIIHAPGRVSARTVDTPAHHADVMPTILGLAGITPGPIQGRNLASTGEWSSTLSPVVVTRFVYPDDVDRLSSDGVEAIALVDYPWKLIALDTPGGRQFELYRLDDDPGEQQNRINDEPGRGRQLAAILDSFLRQQAAARSRFLTAYLSGREDRRVEPAPALQEHLRSLGYIR